MGIDIGPTQTRIAGITVSRAFGDHFTKIEKLGLVATPYVSNALPIDSGDTVILASDGLWDAMNGNVAFGVIGSILSRGENITTSCQSLLQTALHDIKCTDNITIMIIQC